MENKTAPWMQSQYYRVNGIPMVYEEVVFGGLPIDYIVDYSGKKWTGQQLNDNGYYVEAPKTRRKIGRV